MVPPMGPFIEVIEAPTIWSIRLRSLNGAARHPTSFRGLWGNGNRAGLPPPWATAVREREGTRQGRWGSGGPRGKRKWDAGGVRYTFIRSNSSELLHSLDDNGWRHAARGTHCD